MTVKPLEDFFKALDQFEQHLVRLAAQQGELNKLQTEQDVLIKKMKASAQFDHNKLNKHSPIVKATSELTRSMDQAIKDWKKQVDAARPMQALSSAYQQKVVFLVFGKVNAGKSSFVNFIASCFEPSQVKRFYVDQGKVCYLNAGESFKEGFTETTTIIQGVELGNHLVLLDSPGLHSVKKENGDVTRQFIDSADAVLWLTPSDSPGQVQELKDLKAELEKKKPLLPIITRSDAFEEDDWCEVTDKAIGIWRNKKPERRALQEKDVKSRLDDFKNLANGVASNFSAKQPISISVHAYKKTLEQIELAQQAQSIDSCFTEAGLGRLFEQMVSLVDEAIEYKAEKPEQQINNFFQEHVISYLDQHIHPKIQKIKSESEQASQDIQSKEQMISNAALINLNEQLVELVERHKDARNKKALVQEINQLVNQEINTQLKRVLSNFVAHVEEVSTELKEDQLQDFTDQTMNFKRVKGKVAESLAGSGGAAAGAAAGAALGSFIPGVGTILGGIAGGIVGGVLGSKAGSFFIETETITEIVGVSTEEIKNSIKKQFKDEVPKQVASAVRQANQAVQAAQDVCHRMEQTLNSFSQQFAKH